MREFGVARACWKSRERPFVPIIAAATSRRWRVCLSLIASRSRTPMGPFPSFPRRKACNPSSMVGRDGSRARLRKVRWRTHGIPSRCLEPGKEGDVALEVDDQSRVTRGGVPEWKLDQSRLTILLGDRAAKDLGVVGSPFIVVDFAITRDSGDGLSRTLASIFGRDGECDRRLPAESMPRTLREAKEPSAVRRPTSPAWAARPAKGPKDRGATEPNRTRGRPVCRTAQGIGRRRLVEDRGYALRSRTECMASCL